MFLEISQNSQENTCTRVSFLIKLQTCNFIKKRLWPRCFPVSFVKFLRTPFLQNTSGRLLLNSVQFTQFSKRMAAWLLLIFFICLHHQLRFMNSITRIKKYKCLKNVIHQIDSKKEWLFLSASQVLRQSLVGFCLNTGKHFFFEVPF